MAREHLSARDNWQREGNFRGNEAEQAFQAVMARYLDERFDADYKPTDLNGIYGLHDTGRPHGIKPDYVIRNVETGKAIYVEIKRQRAAGNAHERACKYFAPGIIASAQEIANQPDDVIPFWWIFSNGIAEDSRYQREILHWFKSIERHVLLWDNLKDSSAVERHFDTHIRPLLDG